MLNTDELDRLTGGDPAGREALLQQFTATTKEDLTQLHTAIVHKDLKNIVRFAHRIKGSAGLLGITGMAETAGILEESSGSVSGVALQERYRQLCDIFDRVVLQAGL